MDIGVGSGCLCLPAIAQESKLPRGGLRNPVGDEVIRYERVEDIPGFFLDAFNKIGCRLDDRHLSESPVLFFRAHPNPDKRPLLLLVNCEGMGSRGHIFLMHAPWNLEEMPLVLPDFGSMGFHVTKTPGFLAWHADSKTLTAKQTTDMCPTYAGRSTYRIDRTGVSWTLIKMEIAEFNCTDDMDWKIFWEASPWPQLPKR